jgi:hypothetical protein
MLDGKMSSRETKVMPLTTFEELSGGGLEERSKPMENNW